MAIPTWPDIKPPEYGTTEDVENTSLRSTFEDGTVQGRRKFTKSRRTWELKWTALPKADYLTLMDFLINTVHFSASAFLWTSPLDGKTYTARFSSKEPFETRTTGTVSGSITIRED